MLKNENMITVLINAYSCAPNRGSEPGMAWNWITNLSKYCKLIVITEGQWKNEIESELSNFEYRDNIIFIYNPISLKARKMASNQGDWRFYKYYRRWQYKTYLIAREIIKNNKIDIIHQLNMIGFREPGYLWKVKNIPFFWGPVDAKEVFPIAYLNDATIKESIIIYLKNIITKIQLQFSIRVYNAAKRANFVISASSNSQQTFKKYFKINTQLINETGCRIQEKVKIDKTSKETFDVLWVGKFDFRKQLHLALRVIENTKNNKIRLHIVGDGDILNYKNRALKLGINNQCIWHGLVSHQEVQNLMQQMDLLLFTSVAEGTPHVVLEALSNSLPILCFDTCGQGDTVNQSIGIKIPITNPKQSTKIFAEKINYLFNDRNVLELMSENCLFRQKELSWIEKADKMINLYMQAISVQ